MNTFHADIVGSLLRPIDLLEARIRLAAGELDPASFNEIEDRAVDDAIALQEAAGLEVVTDGEMRRQSFQSQMTAAVDGFGEVNMDAFLWGEWHDGKGVYRKARPEKIGATDKLFRRRSLSAREFLYLKSKTTRLPKITVPSPGLWANFWSREYSSSVYPTLDSFLADVVQILRAEIRELVDLGAHYIQIDAPHYGLILDRRTRAFYEQQGWNLSRWLGQGAELDNAIISGFAGVTFALHL
jgi:5-methyltetrahydropteroyltriglutamate--homocysteine methyltransferase